MQVLDMIKSRYEVQEMLTDIGAPDAVLEAIDEERAGNEYLVVWTIYRGSVHLGLQVKEEKKSVQQD